MIATDKAVHNAALIIKGAIATNVAPKEPAPAIPIAIANAPS